MRIITALIGILYSGIIIAQTPNQNELYSKIVNYYRQNSGRLEFVKWAHKNVFKYDTVIYSFYYLPLKEKAHYLFYADSSNSVTGGILFSDKYYVVNANSPEKILTKKKYVDHKYRYVPALHCHSVSSLVQRFGNVKSISRKDNKYIVLTNKSSLEVDPLSYRIIKLSERANFNKEYHQYDDFYYLELTDSIKTSLHEQATTLVNASNDFPVVTLKDLDKREVVTENYEGKSFAFKNMVSFNKGPIDPIIANKYVIIDFFYQACLPCHKMTDYILQWLPTIDSSKIALIGINPVDSEQSMKIEAQKRGINYPIMLGQNAEEISKKYVQGYPTLLLISPDGIIRIVHNGMSKSFLTKAEKIISQ